MFDITFEELFSWVVLVATEIFLSMIGIFVLIVGITLCLMFHFFWGIIFLLIGFLLLLLFAGVVMVSFRGVK
jgi:hypothetical protein